MRYETTKAKGFTLINLMTAISIMVIIIAFAIPSFEKLLKRNQAQQSVRLLHRTLNFARHHAITSNTDTIVCPTLDDVNCIFDWTEPLIVFIDKNNNHIRDESEELQRKITLKKSLQASFSLTICGSGNHRNYFRFYSNGGTGNQSGRFLYELGNNQEYRAQLIYFSTGRVRIVPPGEMIDTCPS